jgi:hypothetical protein
MVPLKKRIAMLFTKPTNHMKKVIYLLVLPVVMLSCLAFARLKNDAPTEKYSVIGGVELSDNIIEVLIDGKNYDNDVLYTISESCIKSVRVKPLDSRKVINGKWVDVKVNIQTKNGAITYMTDTEKENLVKERHARSTTGFYSRVSLMGNDGKPFDKAMINTLTGSTDITVKSEDKVGFVIDGVFYNENDIRVIDSKKMRDIMGNSTVSVSNTKPGEYAKGFSSIFTITTVPVINRKAPVDTTKKKVKLAPAVKDAKSKPATLAKPAVETKKAFLLAKPAAEPGIRIDEPFLERHRIVYADGKMKDKMIFHLADGSASAELGVDDKIGAFIDGVFYDEKALKVLPMAKAKTLITTHEGFDAKKIPDGPYAVPFAFKTKTSQKPVALPATPKTGMHVEKQQPFFSRTQFEDGEGKPDKITFVLSDQIITTNISPGVKTGAFIDGVFYKETELNTLPGSKIDALAQSHGMLDVRKIPPGYHTSFSFRTKDSKGEVGDEVVSTKGMSPKEIEDLNREFVAREVFKRSHYPQFYSRIKFNTVDGKDYDYVVCTIGKGLVSTPVKLNAKTGLLIDGVFYDEETVKKMPDSTGKKLELWREGFDATKVPKDYIAAFTLRTKAGK